MTSTGQLTLQAFLLDRIRDTIAEARHVQAQGVTDRMDPDDPRAAELRLARWVLADCEAKRGIVELHDQELPGWCTICNVPGDTRGRLHGCATVRLLALPYADHPAFRDEWRP